MSQVFTQQWVKLTCESTSFNGASKSNQQVKNSEIISLSVSQYLSGQLANYLKYVTQYQVE